MPRSHRPYDSDFRREAVNLLLSSGRPLNRVADELGISTNTLREWRDRMLGRGCVAETASTEPKGRSGAPLADPAGEIRRLQREVEYLRRQREILKKAMRLIRFAYPFGAAPVSQSVSLRSALSEDPQSGMR